MSFKINMWFILMSQIGISSVSSETKNVFQCVNPKYTGACVALNECPVLFDMIKRFHHLTASEKQLLHDSQCGYTDAAAGVAGKVLVCCPVDKRDSGVNEMLEENVDIENSICGVVKKRETSPLERMSSTSQSDFPWMALIEYVDIRDETRRGFNCSGTLINSRYILTAAHCVNDVYWKPRRIMLGHWDPHTDIDCENNINCLPTNAQRLAVEIDKIIVHPNYPVDLYHDIALIRMKQHIEYRNNIRPICLPFGYTLNKPNLSNTMAEFASWGIPTKSRSDVAAGKFKISLRIWNTHECRKRYRLMKRPIHLKYEICAGGEQDEDTCRGDSGGALMYSVDELHRKVYYAVGVMVGGTDPCGLQGWPNISIDIHSHLQWILYQLTQ